ncbi:MAG TPA: IS3 family transposase [Burkholderiales bacterium]
MKYAFIQAREARLSVQRLCEVLGVSRSGFYHWRGRARSARALVNERLLDVIRAVHERSRQAYGALKTWRALNTEGVRCGKHRVARLRKLHGIEARRKRRFRVTVEHHHTAPAAPDLVRRQFTTVAANRIWVGDMTYIRTREGWLHLAMLLDLYSRRIVGWAMGERPDLALALGALKMAVMHRQPEPGLIHHTDQGPLYSARAYRDALRAHGVRPSMGGKRSAYDNACAESFFSSLKNELVHHCDFASREQARTAIFDYIECFYNRQRLHATLDYQAPANFERLRGVS